MQEKLQIDEPMLPRKRKAPRRYEVGDGQGTFLETVQDCFRAEYHVVIDAALACIRQRFDQPGYHADLSPFGESTDISSKWNRLPTRFKFHCSVL